MTAARRHGAVYQLTVVGELGPVLQANLRTTATAFSELLTVLRMRTQGDEDLLDVLQSLSAHGYEISVVSAQG